MPEAAHKQTRTSIDEALGGGQNAARDLLEGRLTDRLTLRLYVDGRRVLHNDRLERMEYRLNDKESSA
ncbi:MAG: hypothetical protein K0Q59_5458 [Paenibacillus sp.]|nr:hypothetical protein [Paenibacillus sp.]